MGIERRMSQRVPLAQGMRVYAYGMLVASGTSVDMSDHGLLLRIQQDYSSGELDPGRYLDVLLQRVERIQAECWLPIRVVRKWEEGIAARFIGADSAATCWSS